jgi:hypothetical protein
VAAQVGWMTSRCWEVLVSVWVLLVVVEAERVAGTGVGGDRGTWTMRQLVWVLTGLVWTKTFVVARKVVSGSVVWVPDVE